MVNTWNYFTAYMVVSLRTVISNPSVLLLSFMLSPFYQWEPRLTQMAAFRPLCRDFPTRHSDLLFEPEGKLILENKLSVFDLD